MNDKNTSEADKAASEDKDIAQRVTKIILGLCVFLFIWHLFADRITPGTDNARVRSYVVPVAPEVAGKLVRVDVDFSEPVKEGDILAKIDDRQYKLALQEAEADLELAGQDIGASTEQVAVAEAKLSQQRAQLAYVEQQASRYASLAKRGVISQADADKSQTELVKAEADVEAAEADLEKAKEQLGEGGKNNLKIRAAIAALGQARLDLANTEILASTDGLITNVNIEVGQYANTGQPLMTLLSQRDIWIEAYLRENNLGNIKVGDPVDVALDIAPGKIFKAEVASVTLGVQWQKSSSQAGSLLSVPAPGGRLRESQRFPVVIRFKDNVDKGFRYEGGQANVIVYTDGNFLLNSLAWIDIRLSTWLSYIY